MMILFQEFQTDPQAYANSEQFWRELLTPTADSRQWTTPWFINSAVGRPHAGESIFTSWHPVSRKGLFLHQRPPEDASWVFAAYTSVWDPDVNPVDSLTVTTVLEVSVIPRVLHLFEIWSDPGLTKRQMDTILNESEDAGWPSDWHDRFRLSARR